MKDRQFGWKKQPEDPRDYDAGKFAVAVQVTLPEKVDLRAGMPPIVDQGDLGACTANAGAALVDYCLQAAGHPSLNGSRLLLYYNTRVRIEGSPADEDTGATIRGTLKSLAKYGICKESTWPYVISKFSKAPASRAVAEAAKFQALAYALVDKSKSLATVLKAIKAQLAAGVPLEFGFYVFQSYDQSEHNGGCFPYPSLNEYCLGGHAVVAVGYDDTKIIENKLTGDETTGAFLIRNSWGEGWGDKGYGWLPYAYVTSLGSGERLACDWWVLTREEYNNK